MLCFARASLGIVPLSFFPITAQCSAPVLTEPSELTLLCGWMLTSFRYLFLSRNLGGSSVEGKEKEKEKEKEKGGSFVAAVSFHSSPKRPISHHSTTLPLSTQGPFTTDTTTLTTLTPITTTTTTTTTITITITTLPSLPCLALPCLAFASPHFTLTFLPITLLYFLRLPSTPLASYTWLGRSVCL
jgi:hypothetical protein